MLVRDPELLVFGDLSRALDVETERVLWERVLAREGRTCGPYRIAALSCGGPIMSSCWWMARWTRRGSSTNCSRRAKRCADSGVATLETPKPRAAAPILGPVDEFRGSAYNVLNLRGGTSSALGGSLNSTLRIKLDTGL